MGAQSTLDIWLSKLSGVKRDQLKALLRSAPTHQQAFRELKKQGYKGSYDSVLHWRNREQSKARKGENRQEVASFPPDTDPITKVVILASRLTELCERIVDVLSDHEWIELGETRLSSQQAARMLGALPSLARAATGSLIELHQVRSKIDEKLLMEATLAEMSQDWQKALQGDHPELLPVFDQVAVITKARLEIDRSSLLEEQHRAQSHPQSTTQARK